MANQSDNHPGVGKQQAGVARLSAPLQLLQEKALQGLRNLINAMFDSADDALFELVDKADSNQEQTRYIESVREIKVQRRQIENNFLENIRTNFLAIAFVDKAGDTDDEELDIPAEGLALIGHDEIEVRLAVDSMVRRTEQGLDEFFYSLSERMNSLLSESTVDEKNNPLGPLKIAEAFFIATKELDINIKVKLILLQLFETYVLACVDVLYTTCNDYLIKQCVSDGAVKNSSKKKKKTKTTRTTSGVDDGGLMSTPLLSDEEISAIESVKAEHPKINTTTASANTEAAFHSALASDDILNTFQQLLGADTGTASREAANVLNAAALLTTLSHLQVDLVRKPKNSGEPFCLVKESVDNALRAQVFGDQPPATLQRGDSDVVNLVSRLFDFMLNEREWAEPLKDLIARMQIPLLKVALMDHSFLNKGGHPARRLLNEIANASMSWHTDEKCVSDPLYRKIEVIVERILHEFDADLGIFPELLTDFVAFRDAERRRVKLLEKRTIDAEAGKAKSDYARKAVGETLQALIGAQQLPKVVYDLLFSPWSNVMFLVHLKEGVESKAWQSAVETAQDLIWSVQILETKEDRKHLMELVPSLLTRIREGLERISYNPFEMSVFFENLESIHLENFNRILKSRLDERKKQAEIKRERLNELENNASNPIDLLEIDSAGATKPKTLAVTENQKPTATVAPTTKTSLENPQNPSAGETADAAPVTPVLKQFLVLVDKLTMGTWVEFRESESKRYRCRLAAIIKHSGKYIFVNRGGMKVGEKTRLELATELSEGRATLMEDAQLFDQALESVIGSLRKIKDGS